MGKDDVQVWDRSWSGRSRIAFDLNTRMIFENVAKEISFEAKKVLELGCGSGRLSYLAYQAGAEELTLVDFSDAALTTARNLFNEVNSVTFVKANLLALDLVEKYDVAFSSGVVEHFKDEELMLAVKAHANYSRNYVAIVVPSDTAFNNRRAASAKNIKLYGYQKPISPEQMRGIFEEVGITVQVIKRFHFMYGVPILFRLCGSRLGKIGALFASILKPLDHRKGGLLLAIGRV